MFDNGDSKFKEREHVGNTTYTVYPRETRTANNQDMEIAFADKSWVL